MNNTVVLRKSGGFYICFDNDAIILSYLCNYKISNGRVGFSINTINKVTNLLIDNNINYIIKENNNDTEKKKFGKKNKYKYILDKGKKKIDIDYRINGIKDKINNMNEEDINNLLNLIEEHIWMILWLLKI